MIQSLTIQNFQSHKDSYLEFSPGMNVIVGSSDSGKTAILRALRWLIWNRPSGDDFRSNWGGRISVEVITNEPKLEIDPSIIRIKDKQDEYIMNGESYKAFRTDVPKEIADVLNISEINLQQQLDAPFLLSKTTGEVAQHFNKVAGLDKIDIGLQNVNSWIRELTSSIKYTEQQEENLKQNLEKFDYLEKFEIEVEVLEMLETRFRNLKSRKEKLNQLISAITETTYQIEEESKILEIEEPLNNILTWIDEKKMLNVEYRELKLHINDIVITNEEIKEQEQILSLEEPLLNILGLYNKRSTVVNQSKSLSKLITSINGIKGRLITANQNLADLLGKYKREFPNTCPLCETKLK